jgi:DNA replication protein DnaC
LILVGKAGVGNTHLAIGILKELISAKGITCFFCGFQELLEKIKNSYDPSVQTTSMEILRPVFESEIVVLDDLGAVIPTGWVRDTISLILNKRYESSLTTIITTNFQDGPAAGTGGDSAAAKASNSNREQTLGDRIGERMRDRIHEMCRMISIWEVPSFRDRNPSSTLR